MYNYKIIFLYNFIFLLESKNDMKIKWKVLNNIKYIEN